MLVASFITAGLVAPRPAVAAITARKSKVVQRWSEASTWGGQVPREGATVTIPSGARVLLDISPPHLAGLQVDGLLTFARKRIELRTDWIMIHGTFKVGSKKRPFRQQADITLTGNAGQNIMGMGTKAIGVMGGTLELHGRRRPGWTQLGVNAARGARSIVLRSKMPLQKGDRIVIASTDYESEHAEERTITGVSGRRVEFAEPLEWQHWGRLQRFGGRVLDERAEVGLLTRNVTVRGDDGSQGNGFGGHIMVMHGGNARISDVEFTRMGQKKRLRRYPIHFHMDGKAPSSYIVRSSIHHTYNRCITVHGTRLLRVLRNVCYDHLGHGYFLEDGGETDNILKGNLGLMTREVENGLLPSDEEPATFWITNPDNVIKNNHAAGSDRFGFWYALPEHPTGPSHTTRMFPQRTPLKVFKNNVAHSNGDTGLFVDHGPDEDGDTDDATWYEPVVNPVDEDSRGVVAHFDRLTAFMNRNRGVWLRGEDHVVTRARLADNQAGATFASETSYLKRSLVVGESANRGNREEWEEAGYKGRALPAPWEPHEEIVGFEFYDGKVGVSRTHFAGFKANPVRQSGALSYLSPNAFTIHPRNFAHKVSFAKGVKRVYLAEPQRGMDGDASKVFVDSTGSVTGRRGARVVVDNRFLLDGTCRKRASWNAWVCGKRDYATLWTGVSNSGSIDPMKLRRTDGRTQTLNGCCSGDDKAITTLLPGKTYDVEFSAPSARTEFVLWNSGGKNVTLQMTAPGGTKVERWDDPLPRVDALGGLAGRNDSAWHYNTATNTLTVRIVSTDDWSEVEVVRP